MSTRGTASPRRMRAGRQMKQRPGNGSPSRSGKPMLLFFTRATSGPARRMASLVAWIKVTQKRRLQVVEVDVERHADLASRLRVDDVPTLVLVAGGRAVGRLDGRVTGHQIDRMIAPYLS
jgi:thioredoxin